MKEPTKKNPIWVVTDIDGTLMDHNYDFTPALKTISLLKSKKIPIIPCTSKTAAEVRCIRSTIGLRDPFIVENGGAIYGNDESSDNEWKLPLGESYLKLRSKLNLISKESRLKLKALNDLSYEEINSLTGLKGKSIDLALQREWSVPFLNPPVKDRKRIEDISRMYSTKIYQGNRMSHLLSQGSHKGQAVLELKKYLKVPEARVIALGDSPNDLPLLEVADWSIVVPSKEGPNSKLVKGIESGDFILAPAPHAKGWSLSIEKLISDISI